MKNKFLFLVLFLGTYSSAYAQNFEWLRTFGAKSTQNLIMGMSAEPNGGCAFCTKLNSNISKSDTIRFDSFSFIIPSGSGNVESYLVKLDSNGKVKAAASAGTFWAEDMCRDEIGNFYITGQIQSKSIVGSMTMDSSNGGMVFAKFDKDLKFVWAKQYGDSKASGSKLFFSSGYLYFIGEASGTAKIEDSIYLFNRNAWTSIFGQLNIIDGKVKWSKYFYKTTNGGDLGVAGLVRLKDRLYLTAGFRISKVTFGKDTFLGPGALIIETDTLGRYKKAFAIKNRKINVVNIITDGEYIYFGGHFSDTLKWGNQQITTQFRTGPTSGNNPKRELFAASITTSFQPRWFFRPKLLDSLNNKDGNSILKLVHSGGYIYYGGCFTSKIIINGNVLKQAGLGTDILLLKFDFLGNILWTTTGHSPAGQVWAMAAVSDQSVFAGGFFMDKIQLGKYKDSIKGYEDGWLTKITDYSITRGKVSSGPYCAGDTIKIPYSKLGDFDTANVFIAQLSDENGNFESDYRELGRLKTNKDGTIKGVLPSFKVSTSANYRIRILSTKPAVQSYYLRDTLRLLIYSRDKANPGPPETICMGDSIKLNTYGGTKWTWSPKYRMDDSTKRHPWAWPIKDTLYKIIIADSSGCGAPDTAFKKVIVRPALKTVLAFNDTTVCGDGALQVPYYFTGGDSVNYKFQWYFVSNPKLWFTMKLGQNLLRDTLTYTPSDPIEKLAIILKDGCTNKSDTAYLIISQRKPVTIKSTYRDTTPCTGNLLKYKAKASGGVPKQYRYQWKDLVSNSILSTTDSLKILTKKPLKIQLIVNDGCEALGDTALFEVKVKAELKAVTNLRDTTICAGKTLNYNAIAIGGNGKNYKYSWLLNNKQIDTINHLQLTINNSSTLSLITTDNCSSNDTVKKTIIVNPSPKADFSWDLACSRTITKFQFTGTKPNSPITTSFHWNFNNESSSYLENPSYLFTLAGTKKISLALTSSNGCTDTVKKDVVIKPQSKADFTATDVCETDSVVFINKSQDATGYNWKFGDGQNSKLQNPKHKFQISSTTTYNVTLVAQVAGGCSDSISKAVTINKNPSSDFSYTYNGTKVDLKITKAGNSYQWKFGTTDSAKTSATTYSHTIKSSDQTNVCLTAKDISGCSSQTCKNVSVGILKVLKSEGFKLYPNPNNGSFTIEIENPSKDFSIEIFNLLGERVGRVEKVGKVNSLDLGVAEGIHLVRVKNGGVVWNQKAVIAK